MRFSSVYRNKTLLVEILSELGLCLSSLHFSRFLTRARCLTYGYPCIYHEQYALNTSLVLINVQKDTVRSGCASDGCFFFVGMQI